MRHDALAPIAGSGGIRRNADPPPAESGGGAPVSREATPPVAPGPEPAPSSPPAAPGRSPLKRMLAAVAFLVVIGAVILSAAGVFDTGRVEPGRAAEPEGAAAPARTVPAARGAVPLHEEAIGTVRSRSRVAVAAQVAGRILSIAVTAGSPVKAGDPLVTLDGRELAARFAQAKANYERVKKFHAQKAATDAEMEAAEADFLQAKAAVGYTTIAAPLDGVVAERQAEPGDLAWPGRTLLVLHDPKALRLEAQVRERLIARISRGAKLSIDLPAVERRVEGTVAEVLPSADPQSRSFEVWVDFDPVGGVYPGMFGRLRIPTGEREVVRVPSAAVLRIGQLEMVVVRVSPGARWERRLVTTGSRFEDGTVEILSGLRGGETVGVNE